MKRSKLDYMGRVRMFLEMPSVRLRIILHVLIFITRQYLDTSESLVRSPVGVLVELFHVEAADR